MLDSYIVLYREPEYVALDAPMGFLCQAEDVDYAVEQCVNAYPDCRVVLVVPTDDYEEALDDYYALL